MNALSSLRPPELLGHSGISPASTDRGRGQADVAATEESTEVFEIVYSVGRRNLYK